MPNFMTFQGLIFSFFIFSGLCSTFAEDKAAGVDEMSSRFLKAVCHEIIVPVTFSLVLARYIASYRISQY